MTISTPALRQPADKGSMHEQSFRATASIRAGYGARLFFLAAGVGLLSLGAARAQQFSQGFSGSGRDISRNADDTKAYAAAIGQTDPGERASAIQQFLISYPNSSLRRTAVEQLMQANRQTGHGAAPPRMSGPGMAAQPVPGAAVSPAQPIPSQALPAQASAPPRDSLLQKPPKPANITIAAQSLSIKADNSALSQILSEVSGSTGMKVDGLSGDERIFGTYGPGDVRTVLLSLLQGSGYNVLMVGDSHGAPRQLTLSQRSAGGEPTSASAPGSSATEEDSDDVEQEVQPSPEPQAEPVPINPQAPPQRSPQEIQQEMMRLRQQQLQQPNPQQ